LPVEDVWASITEPDRVAQWFGTWTGEAGPGRAVMLTMSFESGAEPEKVVIEGCEPPRLLQLRMSGGPDAWRISVELTPGLPGAGLRLTHHLTDPAVAASAGPGWEYYLDMLAAASQGATLPEWDDYYPAQKDHYERAASELSS